jgi:hypothetical protein
MKRKHCNHVISFVPYKKTGPYSQNSLPPSKKKKRLSHIPTISPNFDTNYIICRKFEKFKKNKQSSKEQNFLKGNRESIEIFWDVLFSTWNLQN